MDKPVLIDRPALPKPAALRAWASSKEVFRQTVGIVCPLNLTGSQLPIYFLPEVKGVGSLYGKISEGMPDHPFIAFQVPFKDRRPDKLETVEQIASRYADQLIELQPKGEFVIGGWSAGAIMAYAVALELAARGRLPALLVAIDQAPLNAGVGVSPYNSFFKNTLIWIHKEYERQSVVSFGKLVASQIALQFSNVAARLTRKPLSHVTDGFINDQINRKTAPFIRASHDLVTWWVPPTKKYPGKVLLYETEGTLGGMFEKKWRKLTNDVKCVRLGRDHESIVTGDEASLLADDLQERLKRIKKKEPRVPPIAAVALRNYRAYLG